VCSEASVLATCVRWGPSSLSPKAKRSPQFSAHICCDQMAGWIKMPLGMELGLSPGNFMLDGDPAPLPKKGGSPPIFGPYLLQPNGCMDQDAVWHGGRPQSRRHCIRWGPSSPSQNESPNFRPTSIVAKWLHGSRCHLVWR